MPRYGAISNAQGVNGIAARSPPGLRARSVAVWAQCKVYPRPPLPFQLFSEHLRCPAPARAQVHLISAGRDSMVARKMAFVIGTGLALLLAACGRGSPGGVEAPGESAAGGLVGSLDLVWEVQQVYEVTTFSPIVQGLIFYAQGS